MHVVVKETGGGEEISLNFRRISFNRTVSSKEEKGETKPLKLHIGAPVCRAILNMDQSDSRTRSTMSGATAMMKASNSGEERDHELGSRPTSIQIAPPPPPTTTPILSSAPHQQQQQPGPSSSGSIVESSSSTILPLRLSHHQPSIASPLRTAIRPHFSSTGSDESTPTASPSTSSEALQAERFLSYSMTTPTRPTENLYRSKSHLDESSGEGSASSSGNVTLHRTHFLFIIILIKHHRLPVLSKGGTLIPSIYRSA